MRNPTGSLLRAIAVSIALAFGASCATGPDASTWIDLFDGESMKGWAPTEFGGEGEVTVRDDRIVLERGWSLTGITWKGEPLPEFDYELEVCGAKLEGSDFFAAITFPVGKGFCSLVLGGWGGEVVGISSIDGMDADSNPTRCLIEFEQGRDYEIRLRVSRASITAWIDGEQVLTHPVPEYEFTVRGEMCNSEPVGIASYETTSAFRKIRWRPLR